MGQAVKLIVNHDAVVVDADGDTWLPYLIQNADGTLQRLGMIRRNALLDGELGDAAGYATSSGTTCRPV